MPQIRTGRKPHNVSQTPGAGSSIYAKATLSGTGTVTNLAGVGPTIGAAAVRAASGINEGPSVSGFTGTANVDFTRMVAGSSTATLQTALDNAVTVSTHKVYWPPGEYRLTTSLTFSVANVEHRFATGPLRTSADTAIVKGSSEVTGSSWGASGANFASSGHTEDFSGNAPASTVMKTVDFPPAGTEQEAYYRDGADMYPLTSASGITGTTDRYYHNRASGVTTIGSTPSGHTIEKLRFWNSGLLITVAGITFKGGIFEHFGFAGIRVNGTGANNPDDFTLQDAEVRYCRRHCISVEGTSTNRVLRPSFTRCYFHHGAGYNVAASQVGSPTGSTQGMTFTDCEMAFGNHFHFGDRLTTGPFSEGNDKILFCYYTTYTGCWIHDADGAAIWPDTENDHCTVTQSVLENNYGSGIHHEQDDSLDFSFNYVANNQKDGNMPAPFSAMGGWGYKGGGVWISASSNCEVHHNWFNLNKHSYFFMSDDANVTYRVENTWVHDNLIYHTDSGDVADTQGGVFGVGSEDLISCRGNGNEYPLSAVANNKFDFNTYHLPAAGRQDGRGGTGMSGLWVRWPSSGAGRSLTEWRAGMVDGPHPDRAPASFFDPNSSFTFDL